MVNQFGNIIDHSKPLMSTLLASEGEFDVESEYLIPKGLRPIFCSFLKFGYIIVVRILMNLVY